MEFKLWLEFEEVDFGNWELENEFTNIQVSLFDGRQYGINVWTFKYLQTSLEEDKQSNVNLNGLYQIPPDLFVKELTRKCIEKTIKDLLSKGNLEDILNPTIISKEIKN